MVEAPEEVRVPEPGRISQFEAIEICKLVASTLPDPVVLVWTHIFEPESSLLRRSLLEPEPLRYPNGVFRTKRRVAALAATLVPGRTHPPIPKGFWKRPNPTHSLAAAVFK